MKNPVLVPPAFVVFALAAGCGDATNQERLWLPEPTGEAAVPASENGLVALVDESTACVVDSYFVRVHCVTRDGRTTAAWGREGAGPGEFGNIAALVRGPEETVAVVDHQLSRLTAFRLSGEPVSETPLPSLFGTKGPLGVTLQGHYMEIGLGLDIRQVEIDAASGELAWERTFPVSYPRCDDASDDAEARGSALGSPAPGGGMVFPTCDGQLILFPDRDGDATVTIARPGFAAELPNEREVAKFAESRRRTRRWRSNADADVEADIAAFRQEPKPWLHLGPKLDDAGRLWVLTSRDRDQFSYMELFVGAEYAGAVRVADRVVGLDVLGAALAVVVEYPAGPGDADGMDDRAVVWYDISELPSEAELGADDEERDEK